MKMVMIGNCEDVIDFVFIGAICEINSKHLVIYLDTRYILVVSSLAIDWKGNDSNICADTMAEIIAAVLDIFRLISLIDVGDLIGKERVQMFKCGDVSMENRYIPDGIILKREMSVNAEHSPYSDGVGTMNTTSMTNF
jgi:acetylglutamate kinase